MSFVDVRDVADAMAAAMDRGRAGERYLLTGMNCTIESFFGRLERLSGVVAPKLRMPKSRLLASLAGDAFARAIRALGGEPPVDPVSLEMSLHYWYCDPEKAVRELGFSPRDPSETLRDTLAYLRERRFALPPEPAAAGELEHRTG
jgi:dihydroflavonol-4-reductase